LTQVPRIAVEAKIGVKLTKALHAWLFFLSFLLNLSILKKLFIEGS
jgi:hypothetical protein